MTGVAARNPVGIILLAENLNGRHLENDLLIEIKEVLDSNRPAVAFDNPDRGTEPKPGSLTALLGRKERVKNAISDGDRDPRTGI